MQLRRIELCSLCLALGLALAAGGAAHAEDKAPPPRGTWGYALANELMSPWCPGFALPDCSSGYAADLRLWILEQEKLGRSEDEVRAEILAKYGEKMLQMPRATGRGILAYAIPAAMILAGLGVLVSFLRRQGTASAGGAEGQAAQRQAAGAPDDPGLLARVDAELAHFESSRD